MMTSSAHANTWSWRSRSGRSSVTQALNSTTKPSNRQPAVLKGLRVQNFAPKDFQSVAANRFVSQLAGGPIPSQSEHLQVVLRIVEELLGALCQRIVGREPPCHSRPLRLPPTTPSYAA